MVKDGVIVIRSGESNRGETSPKEDAGVEPSKEVKSAEEVEELDATEIWVMVDREGSIEWTWVSREGEVGAEDGTE